jgi:hypothetical protein
VFFAVLVIELDKTAPAFDVPALDAWYNEKFSKQFSVTEKNTIKEVYAWTNTKTVDTEVPSGSINITAIGKNVTLGTEDINWNLAQSDANYLHVKVVDEVGNATCKSYQFGFDNVISTETVPAGSISFEKTAYGVTSAKTLITYNDKDVSTLRRLKKESIDYEDKFFVYKKSDNWTTKDTTTFVTQTKNLEKYLLNRFYEKPTSSSSSSGKTPPTKR